MVIHHIANYDMDADLLKAILTSYGNSENIVQSDGYNNVSRETILCPKSNVLDVLSTSLSHLLCYKVSKEAHQRYSVRTLIIDILRKWCRTTKHFESLHIFTSKENNLKFASNLLDKYLTDDVLNNCYPTDALISLTIAVLHLAIKNPSFMHHVDRLLVRLSQLETNDIVERLLHDALFGDMQLKLCTKEEIYASQKFKLIEKPLFNNFLCMLDELNETNAISESDEETLNELLKFSANSPYIFQLLFSFLKELLIYLQYAPMVINFIESVLMRIAVYCENQNTDILDLYPRKLQSCIILLRIKPEHHTVRTRECTLQIMKKLYTENKVAIICLISHFPDWLEYFATYIQNDGRDR